MARSVIETAAEKCKKLFQKLGKYKYAVLILLLGVLLMLLPTKPTEEKTEPAVQMNEQAWLTENENRLANALSELDGAGKVKVMLTIKTSTQYYFQSDHTMEQDRKTDITVYAKNGSNQEPIVIKSDYPEYLGAVILAEGADRAEVQLQITQAVSDLTGLGSDKISVFKMKQQ